MSWLALLLVVPTVAAGQTASEAQRLFEAGRFQQVVETTQPDAEPTALFIEAQSQQKLGAIDEARGTYERLASRDESDPWRFIGESALRLLDDNTDAAQAAARRATELAGDLADAHFQLGLVLARRQEWANAAAAFDRAAELRPNYAYAHYNGGLMHYRANRTDRMANHFEQFLKLAPEAPERPEVLQIMRTVRGR
jgi:tetratricopeptide (TPR) repeat protein